MDLIDPTPVKAGIYMKFPKADWEGDLYGSILSIS